MSCGCNSSGDSGGSCGSKMTAGGCANVDTCADSYKLNVFDWLSEVDQPLQNRCNYVEVRFKNDRKSFFHNASELPLHIGSVVAVEANPGHDIGVVSLTGELVKIQMKKKEASQEEILKIYRVANSRDIEVWQESRKKEEAVKVEARKIAGRLGLEMKISDIEYQGDGTKITFYYTAEKRVDFRQLIKDYAVAFRCKIDMKQIGYRQEAAKVGGIGSCGRELCCSTWLTDFRSVSTQAARYQQLSINPQKLAGQCGKLKCCLNFELDSYMDTLNDFPSSSTILETEKGKAFCIKIDVFKRKMWFAYEENSMRWFDLNIEDVKSFIQENKKGKKIMPLEDFNPEEEVGIDLVEENDLNRFEKERRNSPSKRSGKRKKRKKESSEPTNHKKPQGSNSNGNRKRNKSQNASKENTQKRPKNNEND